MGAHQLTSAVPLYGASKPGSRAEAAARINESRELPRLIALWPIYGARFAIIMGSLVLIGWLTGWEPLKRVLPGSVAMNPATACLFIFCGCCLKLQLRYNIYRAARILAAGLAAILIIAGLCELLEAAGVWHSMVDELLFADSLSVGGDLPNRMAPNTAMNFVLLGVALLMVDRKSRHGMAQALAAISAFIGFFALIGYLYGVHSFRGVAAFIPMAVHTAVTFIVFGGALFFATPTADLSEVFAASDARGVLARRLFPLAVATTLVLGWLRLYGEKMAWFEPALGTALFATVLSLLLALLVRWVISAVGKVEAERATANARLAELNRRKDEMIAVVSHDLCSPLTGFQMVIELLREQSEPTEDLLNLMDHSTRRMVAMVKGLLDVSKLQSDKMVLERKHLHVSEIIRHAIRSLTINANAKQITLKLEVAPDEPTILADPLRVAQIFNNLVSNAVKFTGPGGKVTATVKRQDNGVSVAVADTGLGIPEPELPHLFDKFHQTTTKATAGEVGAGLGLAIVREIVTLHHGTISVTSEVGRGSTFQVYLPDGRSN